MLYGRNCNLKKGIFPLGSAMSPKYWNVFFLILYFGTTSNSCMLAIEGIGSPWPNSYDGALNPNGTVFEMGGDEV